MNITELLAEWPGVKARITSLEEANTKLTTENTSLRTQVSALKIDAGTDASAPLVAEQTGHAETKRLLTEATGKLTAAEQRATTAETKLATAETALTETKASLSTLNASLPKERTQAVVDILGKLGIAPVKEQSDSKAPGNKPDFSHLSGLERAIAAHKAEAATKN